METRSWMVWRTLSSSTSASASDASSATITPPTLCQQLPPMIWCLCIQGQLISARDNLIKLVYPGEDFPPALGHLESLLNLKELRHISRNRLFKLTSFAHPIAESTHRTKIAKPRQPQVPS